MKVRKVIDLCKKEKTIQLYDTEGLQWVSNGFALYPMWGIPPMSEVCFKNCYDFTNEQWEKILCVCQNGFPAGYDSSDMADGERPVSRVPLGIRYGGVNLAPFIVSDGIAWMDTVYLSPFGRDEKLEVYERRTDAGGLYFAVKIGFEVVAIILPYIFPQKEMCEHLEFLARMCRRTLEREQDVGGEQVTIEEAAI